MGKNIFITFLSMYSKRDKKDIYKADDSDWFEGDIFSEVAAETGYLAIQMFLGKNKRKIDEIILLCTDETKNHTPSNEYFRQAINFSGTIKEVVVHSKADSLKINELFNYINKGDKVFLDITSGLRYQSMQYSLLCNILPLRGINLEKIICADPSKKIVLDITKVYKPSLEIINGINAFNNTGNSRQLCETINRFSLEILNKFTKALNDFSDAFLLSRPNIEKYSEVLKNELTILMSATGTPVLPLGQALLLECLPIIQSKISFLNNDKITILDIIEWAIDNDLIMYGLAMFVEYIPDYYFSTIKIIDIPDGDLDKSRGHNLNYNKFYNELPKICNTKGKIKAQTIDDIINLNNLLDLDSKYQKYIDLQKDINDIYNRSSLAKLVDKKNDLFLRFIKTFPNNLTIPNSNAFPNDKQGWKNNYRQILFSEFSEENLKEKIIIKKYLIEENGGHLKVSETLINRLYQDFLKVTDYRNLLCHCSDDIVKIKLEDLTTNNIKGELHNMIQFIRGIKYGK